ncbi:5-(carboxyamino)imidazole ribonucleotide synthase [Pontibacillus yanchengensis]|uniref:5-(Carboxyamino)imidazole ribonucleotide synthase n=1 Tax=Pontibacillus yanchengensis TaxID=462910 RepID=A0ACC7VMH4_9BACI|nr:5-(carboxyamino)imidazole ribonucleotide synthase [Pontibacillus yanchengensis]MYL55554.1 5-(carboxyamino)imidazole ribonucleotide synthase [Pontibacillus yanchengensis]
MSHSLFPGKTIGILGGGQLGKMMAMEAKQMGYRIAVLDPSPNAPCAQVADEHIQAALDDVEAAIRLTDIADVITYEFENVDLELANELEKRAKLPQGSYALKVTQDRGNEKLLLTEAGVAVAPYRLVETVPELHEAVTQLGYPCVIKTTRGGYDGKGQQKLESVEDLQEAEDILRNNPPCVVEAWLPFDMEISVVMTRGIDGDLTMFPVPENIHEDHILRQSIAPARVSAPIIDQAKEAAQSIADRLQFLGTFAFEMFVVGDEVYVNEMAPRPHNSGHYTIEACNVSQFGQHVRAICGLPLLDVQAPYAAVMTNILGHEIEPYLEDGTAFKGKHVHLYGKDGVKPKRKLGHTTVVGTDVDALLQLVQHTSNRGG